MNDETYENLISYIDKEIKHYKLHLNYFYGTVFLTKKAKESYEKLGDDLTQLQSIKLFVQYVHRNAFDKRFFDLMFSSDLSPYVDTKKLTHAIVELVASARHKFPRKVKK